MPDDPGSTVSYKHLIRLEKRGIDVYLPGDSEKEYKVKDLLGTIAPGKATEEEERFKEKGFKVYLLKFFPGFAKK